MFTDTHCHLADTVFKENLSQIITQAQASGINRFIVPATHLNDFDAVLSLINQPNVHIALGIHPWFINNQSTQDLMKLEQYLQRYPNICIGEIGLDFHHQQPTQLEKQRQLDIFQAQLKLAQHYHRPVILHNVKSTQMLINSIKSCQLTCGGIIHAFSGSLEEAYLFMKQGFFIGIGSLLLNPNAKKIRQAATQLPLESIVLETDSPFMLHNQINTPATIKTIAEIIINLRQITLETLSQQTENNVNKLLTFN